MWHLDVEAVKIALSVVLLILQVILVWLIARRY